MSRLIIIAGVFVVLFLGVGVFVQNNPESLLAFARDAERGRAGVVGRTVEVDGETFHYLDGGQGETILMLHGFGADKDNWTRFSRYLTPEYRIIAPDLPGFGESARHQDRRYDLASQRDRLHGFVQALGLERFHIVGNSMGGYLAGLYAHAQPERVRSIGFFDNAGVSAPQLSDYQIEMAQGRNPLLVDSLEDFETLLDFVFVQQPPIPKPVKNYLARRAVANREFNAKLHREYRQMSPPLEPLLKDLSAPALVLWGDSDRLIHVSSVEVMKRELRDAQVVVMKDCGHSPMIERPEETAIHYRGFLEQLEL